jgi:hypothetical protein
MAGKYIEFVNPGYSTLYTRDLKYTACHATRDSADPANPFNPDSVNPILEGEWLSWEAGNTVTRGSGSTPEAAAAGSNIMQEPCLLHFSERGRYDAQITKKAHLVSGPVGYEFKCKLGLFTSGSEGQRLFVCDVVNPSASSKFVKGMANVAGLDAGTHNVANTTDNTTGYYLAWSPGYITRFVSTSEVYVQYDPQYIVLNKS